MSDLGPTTQMTITRFRESLLDDKNSLVSISLMTRLLLSAFFSRESVLLHLPIT